MKSIARRTGRLALVPMMLAGQPLIPALVVARQSCHQLLSVCAQRIVCFSQELFGFLATQRRCDSSMVKDLDIAVLAASVAEAKVRRFSC